VAKPRRKSLPEETVKVLNHRLTEVENSLKRNSATLVVTENQRAKVLRALVAAELDADALLAAVRVLAEQVSSTTAAGRRARKEARLELAARSIAPPSTLGAPRNRPKVKRKK
jgi:hypothetical protein